MFGSSSGFVIEFDAHRGTGVISGDDGKNYPFHCTELKDGKRSIAIGAKVIFEIAAGLGGITEARSIVNDER